MTGFQEPDPALISPNPGGANDPLGESVLDPAMPWCRIFAPTEQSIVIGRHQSVHREVLIEACQQDGVPIYRRLTGGGAVVLAPPMVVIALRLAAPGAGTDSWLCAVAKGVAAVVGDMGGPELAVYGHGDLAKMTDNGPRKVLGASLRRRKDTVYYLGVLLLGDAIPLMERYLQMPSRLPDYRMNRTHRDFCASLAPWKCTTQALVQGFESYAHHHFSAG